MVDLRDDACYHFDLDAHFSSFKLATNMCTVSADIVFKVLFQVMFLK